MCHRKKSLDALSNRQDEQRSYAYCEARVNFDGERGLARDAPPLLWNTARRAPKRMQHHLTPSQNQPCHLENESEGGDIMARTVRPPAELGWRTAQTFAICLLGRTFPVVYSFRLLHVSPKFTLHEDGQWSGRLALSETCESRSGMRELRYQRGVGILELIFLALL